MYLGHVEPVFPYIRSVQSTDVCKLSYNMDTGVSQNTLYSSECNTKMSATYHAHRQASEIDSVALVSSHISIIEFCTFDLQFDQI